MELHVVAGMKNQTLGPICCCKISVSRKQLAAQRLKSPTWPCLKMLGNGWTWKQKKHAKCWACHFGAQRDWPFYGSTPSCGPPRDPLFVPNLGPSSCAPWHTFSAHLFPEKVNQELYLIYRTIAMQWTSEKSVALGFWASSHRLPLLFIIGFPRNDPGCIGRANPQLSSFCGHLRAEVLKDGHRASQLVLDPIVWENGPTVGWKTNCWSSRLHMIFGLAAPITLPSSCKSSRGARN